MPHAAEPRAVYKAADLHAALRQVVTGQAGAYRRVGQFEAVERIAAVKAGLPAQLLATLAGDMQIPRERLYAWLGLPRTTANRKLNAQELLSQDESERVLGITRLVGLVQRIVAESGEPRGFDAALWTAQWLEAPNLALGGRPPGEFMDTADGRALVAGLVAQMQTGAYA